MSDPTRWLDDPSSAPSGAAGLLSSAKQAPVASAAARARMGARIAASTAAKPLAFGVRSWIAGGTVGLAVALFGLFAARRHAVNNADASSHATPHVVIAPVEGDRIVSRSPTTVVSAHAAPAVEPAVEVAPNVTPSPPPSAPDDTPRAARVVAPARVESRAAQEREEHILELARAALQSDPTAALARVHDHLSEFPHGQLSEEREYIAVRALARLGRTSEARARAQAFLRRYPAGIYSSPVQRVLDTVR
jgi:hypothetical protein